MSAAILGDVAKVELGGTTVQLRPTLRAAIAAHDLLGGFPALGRAVDELSSVVCADLLRIGAPGCDTPQIRDLVQLQPALMSFVATLASAGRLPGDDDEADAPPAKPLTHPELFERLFKIGTGWLGWTPDATLDAPMPAIIWAFSGRQEMFRALFGGGETPESTIPLDQKFMAFMASVGTTKVEPT